MKQTKQGHAEQQPQIWCEDCSVRIAPYEDFVTHKNRKLHRQCFQKAEQRAAARRLAPAPLSATLAQVQAVS